MKATVINNSQNAVALPGAVVAQPGTAKTVTGLTLLQAAQLTAQSSKLVQVQISLDPADKPAVIATMATPANPGSGVTVLAGEGFTLKDSSGTTVAIAEPVGLGVYDDAACTIPSADAYIDTATAGTITAGSGTNAIEATTAAGVLTVSVHKPAPGTVYVKPFTRSNATRVLDASDQRTTIFIP